MFEEYAYNYQISYVLVLQTLGQHYFAPRTFYDFRARLYRYTIDHPQEADVIFSQFDKERKVWLAKDDKDIAASSLQPAHDADATFRKKAGKGILAT